ncbi:hypothetical protein P7K49_038461, partial [Saguinus oedipus]
VPETIALGFSAAVGIEKDGRQSPSGGSIAFRKQNYHALSNLPKARAALTLLEPQQMPSTAPLNCRPPWTCSHVLSTQQKRRTGELRTHTSHEAFEVYDSIDSPKTSNH